MFLIDKELCTGCGQCVDVCPADAIRLQETKAVIDQSLCRQCGICADQCPVQAISESVPAYAAQTEHREPLVQQRPGMLSQVLDIAGRFFTRGLTGGGRGRGGGGGRGRGGGGGRGRGGGGGRGKRSW